MAADRTLDAADMRLALTRVLKSRVFERAHRSQRFLSYLVEGALAQPPLAIKEYTVAIEVFDRDVTYNSSIDAAVRVEASRLRSRLREYYTEEGSADPWIIEIPKGAYNVTFTPRAPVQPVTESLSISAGAGGEISPEPPESPLHPALPLTQVLRRPRHLWIGWLLLFVLVAGTVVVWHSRRPHPQAATVPEPISLAVLPIANRTGDQNLDYVADGLTDDLIRELSWIPALRLVGRSTVFRYRRRLTDAQTVIKTLHVNAVMTGELRRAPDHTSLAVEITNADGFVVLDREYIADKRDLQTAQADLQRDILMKLHVEGSARDPGRVLRSVTSNPEAYQEFLESDALIRTMEAAGIHQAILHLEKAVTLDPQFDLAWSMLASEHLFLGIYFEPPREHMPLARRYAQRALEINPSLGEAHGSLGLIHLVYDWDLQGAEAEMQTADAEAAAINTLPCTVHLLQYVGKAREAEEMLSRMLSYDPRSSALIAELGCGSFYRGNYDAALRHSREALQLDPQTPIPYWNIGKTLNAEHKYGEAMKVLRSFKERNGFEPPVLTAEIGYSLGASGQREQALEIIRRLSENPNARFIDPYLVSVVYLGMNDRLAAFQWLNKALDVRSAFAISILSEPKWRPFHDDPHFAQAVQRMLAKEPGSVTPIHR